MIPYKDIIKKAPISFQGQKRFALKKLYDYYKDYDFNNATIYDVFGGSGLLSNFFKQMYPGARVIYNDYDGYTKLLEEADLINEYLKKQHDILVKYDIQRHQRVRGAAVEELHALADEYKNIPDFIKYKYITFAAQVSKNTYYRQVKESPKVITDNYLKGVEVVSCDFTELIKEVDGNGLYIFDPPYPDTDANNYKRGFDTAQWLQLYKFSLQLKNFIYFTSYNSYTYLFIDGDFKELIKPVEIDERIVFHSSMQSRVKHNISEIAYIKNTPLQN